MKSKRGYMEDKTKHQTGKWLKWYFEKKTCRRSKSEKLMRDKKRELAEKKK